MKPLCCCCLLLTIQAAFAQFSDISSSYPFRTPTVNPANTGFFADHSLAYPLQIHSSTQVRHDQYWSDWATQIRIDHRIPVLRKDYIN